MKTDLVFNYLKSRAIIEGVCFELSQKDFFEPLFYLGTRIFYGVSVDDNGFLISDVQVPKSHPHLIAEFMKSYRSEN